MTQTETFNLSQLKKKKESRNKGADVEYPSCAEANEYLAEDRVMCL